MTTPRDDIAGLIERLLEQITSDHIRGCMGRQYSCDCGYDLVTEGLLEQAATQLDALSARVKELEGELVLWSFQSLKEFEREEGWQARALRAEQERDKYERLYHNETVERLRAEQERDELEAQLPDGMKHCTITFHECEKGHGRLSATNWIDSGCPWCQRDEAYERAIQAVRDERLIDPVDSHDQTYNDAIDHAEQAIRRLAGPEKEKKE